MKPHDKKTIVLTGASGVVGQALLDRFTNHNIICLVHRTPVKRPDVTSIQADITLPNLGLDRTVFADLARRADCIIHSAAVTDFKKPHELIRSTNISGLAGILEFAALSRAPLYHISTAFVHAAQNVKNPDEFHVYTASKHEGERMVRESGLPYVIVRPSIVMGDSVSGAMTRFQGLHSILVAGLKGLVPLLPMSPQAYIDFIPCDVMSSAIAALVEDGETGGEYWLASGKDSITVADLVRIHSKFCRSIGVTTPPPKFTSPETFERLFRPVFLAALPRRIRLSFENLMELAGFLSTDDPFPTSLPELETRFKLSLRPDPETVLTRNLEYWVSSTGYTPDRKAASKPGRRVVSEQL